MMELIVITERVIITELGTAARSIAEIVAITVAIIIAVHEAAVRPS